MYASKSFCNIKPLISNTPGVNAPAGEISPTSRTFSREIGYYSDPTKPDYSIINLSCVSNEVQGSNGASTKVVMNGGLVNQAVALVDFVYQKAITTSGQIFSDDLLTQLVQFGATLHAVSITIGLVEAHNGKWLPEWIKWSSDDITEENEHQIWLVDASLQSQYSDYEIVVVPPLDNLDLFFTTGANVISLISAITVPQTMDRIQLARAANPETILRSDDYDYINAQDSSITIAVNWPVLIYGPAGNNIDAIKEALIDYILSHSTHPRTDWIRIFPDIFKRTEFLMAPGWQYYAIPNAQMKEGVYSPIANPAEAVAYMKQVASEYPPAHVEAHTSILGFPYRSLSIVACGGTENRDNKFEISDVFPDYINVSTSSNEFNRMSTQTQLWVSMLEALIIQAEKMTETTTMPQGMMKLKRANILYAVKTYQNIQYLVASKRSVYAMLGIDPESAPV